MAKKKATGTSAYRYAHDKVRALRGKASQHDCVDCGLPAKDWAMKRPEECIGNMLVVRVGSGPRWFSDCSADYEPKDRACHLGQDALRRRQNMTWSV